jgi:hypothetical protein
MRVFLDTNILLDVIEQRRPFFVASQAVMDCCDKLGSETHIAWHGLATMFYITAKKQSEAYAFLMVRSLLSWATVATVGHQEAHAALGFGINDYEAALQAAAAPASGAYWIVTRDVSGFSGSPVPAISPNDFLTKFASPASGAAP